MPALQIVKADLAPEAAATLRRSLDLLVEGMNLTARLPETDRPALLRDLSTAIDNLASLRTLRATVGCHGADGPWELGLERIGDALLVSLYRGGALPEVAIFERRVELRSFAEAVSSALDALASSDAEEHGLLDGARRQLSQLDVIPLANREVPLVVRVEPESDAPIQLGCELSLRPRWEETSRETTVERSDLFALLVKGTLAIAIGGKTRAFADTFVFLFAEQLVALAHRTLDDWEKGRSYHRRTEMFGVVLGIRIVCRRIVCRQATATSTSKKAVSTDPAQQPGLWLSVGASRPAPSGDARTFRLADGAAFAAAAVGFGRGLARALLRHDPAQRLNLRLSGFRRSVRALDDRLREAKCDDAKINPAPEIYRVPPSPAQDASSAGREASKLRFFPAWAASFPGIDLAATFLCGDHLIVGAARETACIDRRTGDFLWRRPTPPAVSVVTPLGLARLFADGSIAVLDYASGETVLTALLTPRAGGVVTGGVVSSPGLPRLLVVSEGRRHLSALDLESAELRWRHSAQGSSTFRLRRAGKLLIVVAGDATLTALAVSSGEIVWRTRDRLRFSTRVGLDHDSLFALAGGPDKNGIGLARLYHLDPYAGVARWVRELSDVPCPLGAPLVTDREVVMVTRDRRGLGLLALDRATGETLWSSDQPLFPMGSAWLIIDDSVVASSESGIVACWDTRTGETRWRHRFARGMEGDQPRRLEPILRSGALFVPQQQVHVIRPRDGALLGQVPSDLIPDLLRVDERCDVYVAEEGGQLASFRAGAKLSVV